MTTLFALRVVILQSNAYNIATFQDNIVPRCIHSSYSEIFISFVSALNLFFMSSVTVRLVVS
jgi:hypothetical protein